MLEHSTQKWLANALWMPDFNGILRRSGFYDAYKEALDSVLFGHPDELPLEAANYLSNDNPRLIELKNEYDALLWNIREFSQWSPAYVAKDVPLRHFRGDCAFLWQKRDLNLPIHYLCTYLHLKQSGYQDLLPRCTEDAQFGAITTVINSENITRDRLDSISQLGFLRSTLNLSEKSEITILDIGSGYGRLAHRITQCFPKIRVLCVDVVPESTFLCEFYLRFRQANSRTRVIPLHELHVALADEKIDVATAINSFSECSTKAIQGWLDILFDHKVPFLLVVPHAGQNQGKQLFNPDYGVGGVKDFEPMILASGYKKLSCTPKYDDPLLQKYGVSPTHYHFFAR